MTSPKYPGRIAGILDLLRGGAEADSTEVDELAAQLRRVPELSAQVESWTILANRSRERAEAAERQVEHLNARISQLLDTCKRLGVEMSRDGYGRNARAEALEAALRLLKEEADDPSRCFDEARDFRRRHALSNPCLAAVEAALAGAKPEDT